jgi:transposase
MPAKSIPTQTIRNIITLRALSHLSCRELSTLFDVAASTVGTYLSAFERSSLSLEQTRRLSDKALVDLLSPPAARQPNCRQRTLVALFPSIHQSLSDSTTSLLDEWKSYKRQHPQGLRYSRICQLYDEWLSTSGLTKWPRNRWTVPIAHDDYRALRAWRSSNDKRKWQRAVVLLDLHRHCTIASICRKLERSPKTIKKWRRMFLTEGLASLALPSKKAVNKVLQALITKKKERLVKIIHEPPSLHGVNRTAWTLETLSAAYLKVHGESVSRSMVSLYFKELGYQFKTARKVLTSPHPEYRTKLKKITAILLRLGPREKFFSIDEFGPCAVKRRGGRALVPADVIRTIPQRQRNKGSLICTAALELSTNQVTHFYSKRKNTAEMIKMLETLVTKYRDQEQIYLSWDAASWHASKAFVDKVEAINAQHVKPASRAPRVELAPLPSGAQFLNVIESVLSGMARAVIHNSDYGSVNECKRAIDRHFRERNAAFGKNPRRAGDVIWGKEREPPFFSEANNCKDPRYR